MKSLEFDKKELESQFLVEDISMDTIETLSADLKKLLQVIEDKELRWLELNEKLANYSRLKAFNHFDMESWVSEL